MAEQLQGLLDRIQRDGVDKAKAEAETIIADARIKAADLIADAEAKAATLRQAEERDGGVVRVELLEESHADRHDGTGAQLRERQQEQQHERPLQHLSPKQHASKA